MLPASWQSARHVVVILIDDVKGVVMASPALRTLRQALPQAKITLLTSPGGSRVAPLLPWIDRVLICPSDWPEALLPASRNEPALVETIRAYQFDAAVILTGFGQSPYPAGYICYLAGIPIRLGQSSEFGGGVLSQTIKPAADTLSLVDHHLYLLESAGFPLAGRYLELRIPGPLQHAADTLLRPIRLHPEAPFVVLAFGLERGSRRSDPARFTSTVRLLMSETRMPLVLLGSRWDRKALKPILNNAREYPLMSLCGRTTVAEFAAVINRASLVIANDPEAIAITQALQRPLVTLSTNVLPAPERRQEQVLPDWLVPDAGLARV